MINSNADASSGLPMIALRDIRISFPTPSRPGEIQVLTGLSLDVMPGEFLAIAGRSGSGKTTLLRIAAGLLTPAAGTVTWQGVALEGSPRGALAERRRGLIGFVFQSGGLLEHLTAAENVALGHIPTGIRIDGRKRAQDLLARVGLDGRSSHFPAQLSGGERQRVAIARALFGDPPLVIVDEPTANLDRSTADEVIGLLAELRGDGRTLLVASHDVHLVQRADRVLHID
jgi:ABC-type lipoprotein export system ATPase subunit